MMNGRRTGPHIPERISGNGAYWWKSNGEETYTLIQVVRLPGPVQVGSQIYSIHLVIDSYAS